MFIDHFKVHPPKPSDCDTVNFTPHSKLIHNFVIVNELDVYYSYFNTARGVYSWIDDMLFTDCNMINVKSGKFIPRDAVNISNHISLMSTM